MQLLVRPSIEEAKAHWGLDQRGLQEPAGNQERPWDQRLSHQQDQGRILQSKSQRLPYQDYRRNSDFRIRKLPQRVLELRKIRYRRNSSFLWLSDAQPPPTDKDVQQNNCEGGQERHTDVCASKQSAHLEVHWGRIRHLGGLQCQQLARNHKLKPHLYLHLDRPAIPHHECFS